jgi:hypothetical protein
MQQAGWGLGNATKDAGAPAPQELNAPESCIAPNPLHRAGACCRTKRQDTAAPAAHAFGCAQGWGGTSMLPRTPGDAVGAPCSASSGPPGAALEVVRTKQAALVTIKWCNSPSGVRVCRTGVCRTSSPACRAAGHVQQEHANGLQTTDVLGHIPFPAWPPVCQVQAEWDNEMIDTMQVVGMMGRLLANVASPVAEG